MEMMARLTCAMPSACSWLEAAISATTSVTFFTLLTISCNALPEASTSLEPSSTFATDSRMRFLISFAAAALRAASIRTSEATIANPRPWSPA